MNVNLRKNSILFTFICIPHPNTIHMKTLFIILNIFLFTFQISAQPLQRVAPEQVGMNSRHLTYADQAIEKAINNKDIPGAVLAVVRHGKLAYLKAYGCKQTFPTREPMDTHINRHLCPYPYRTGTTPPDRPGKSLPAGIFRRNPHQRPSDTHLRATGICSRKQTGRTVRLSQSGRTHRIHSRL